MSKFYIWTRRGVNNVCCILVRGSYIGLQEKIAFTHHAKQGKVLYLLGRWAVHKYWSNITYSYLELLLISNVEEMKEPSDKVYLLWKGFMKL